MNSGSRFPAWHLLCRPRGSWQFRFVDEMYFTLGVCLLLFTLVIEVAERETGVAGTGALALLLVG